MLPAPVQRRAADKHSSPTKNREQNHKNRTITLSDTRGVFPAPKTPYVFAIFAKKMVRVPPKTESRRPNPGSLALPEPRIRGPNHESRIPNHVSAIFAKKMVRVPPKTASRIPKAWPGPARGAGARITNPESRITFLPFSPKKSLTIHDHT